MAREFIPDFIEENDDQNSQGNQQLNVPVSPGSANSVPTNSSLANPKTQRKASSGFTNLKNYLTANQNNKLGTQVTEPIQSKLQTAQSILNDSQTQFQNQLANEKAKVAATAQKATDALGYVENGTGNPVPVAPEATAEEKAARVKAIQDANNSAAESLSALKNHSYSGPSDLVNKEQLVNNQFDLNDYANASKNESGRGAILQTLFGKAGNYSSGARNLDNYLLSSNQDALTKLNQLRAQTRAQEQNLKAADLQSAANVASARGVLDSTKAINKSAMEQLRDKIRQSLLTKATEANTAGAANAGELSDEELRKFLPELAGYELTSLPASPDSELHMTQQLKPKLNPVVLGQPEQDGPQIILPGVSPEEQHYIDLYANKNFESWQKKDPNHTYTRDIQEAGTPLHGNWTHTSVGDPTDHAYLDINQLKPLFSQSYNDNTWDSIDNETLERRNLLTQVLGDNVENGLMTPKQKQEVQTSVIQDTLSRLMGLPARTEENFEKDFFAGAPGDRGMAALGYFEQSGAKDPMKYMRDLGLDFNPRVKKQVETTGGTVDVNYNPVYNDKTGKMEFFSNTFLDPYGRQANTDDLSKQFGIPEADFYHLTPEELKAKGLTKLNTLPTYTMDNGQPLNIKNGAVTAQQLGSMSDAELKANGITRNLIAAPELAPMSGQEYLNKYQMGASNTIGWNDNISPGLVAKLLQQKYLKDQLKALGIDPSAVVVR